EYGIWLDSGIAFDSGQGIVGISRLTKAQKDRDGNYTGTNENITQVIIGARFVWPNPNGRLEMTDTRYWPGYGDDAGDKGVYKALTGAEKYLLMKTFLVSTG